MTIGTGTASSAADLNTRAAERRSKLSTQMAAGEVDWQLDKEVLSFIGSGASKTSFYQTQMDFTLDDDAELRVVGFICKGTVSAGTYTLTLSTPDDSNSEALVEHTVTAEGSTSARSDYTSTSATVRLSLKKGTKYRLALTGTNTAATDSVQFFAYLRSKRRSQ